MSRRQLEALLAESGEGLDAVDRAHLHEELGTLLRWSTTPRRRPRRSWPRTSGSPHRAVPVTPGSPPPWSRPTTRRARPRAGPPPDRPSGAVTGAVVLAVATVGATGLSAAANSLPAPLQRHVADLSRTYLPFAFPEPRSTLDRPASGARPAPEPVAVQDDAPDDATRQVARVPSAVREGTLVGSGSAAVTDAPVAADPLRGLRTGACVDAPLAGPTARRDHPDAGRRRGRRGRTASRVGAPDEAGARRRRRPTRRRHERRPDGSPVAAARPAPPSYAVAPPRPAPGPVAAARAADRPGAGGGRGRRSEPAPAKGDQVPDDRGGRGDAPSQDPRPRGVVDPGGARCGPRPG